MPDSAPVLLSAKGIEQEDVPTFASGVDQLAADAQRFSLCGKRTMPLHA